MTTSVLLDFGSPDFKIQGMESKYDFVGAPNSFIKCFIDRISRFEAIVLFQFLRWSSWSNSGVFLQGRKWIYKSVAKLIEEVFCGATPYRVRKALQILESEGFILRKQLHREHYGDVHACSAYNRQYYISPMIEAVNEQINSALAKYAPETTSTLGFLKNENQINEGQKTDLRMSKNNTHSTFTSNPSPTPPLTPQGAGESNQVPKVTKTAKSTQPEQSQSNPVNHRQNSVNPEPTPFTDVVKRPSRVEQKINKNKPVQKPVQISVQVPVQEQQPEAVQVEVMPPKQVERQSKRNKTPQGTKPDLDFGLAPWKTLEQFRQFYRALIKKLPIVANSRSPQGLANTIIQQLKNGVPHSYWDDFINGLPIGTSTQQEWEVEPGVPHPMFIEYLTEKLIEGNNSQTREQAVFQALNIASSPKQAIFFWKECKISLGNALDEAERHRNLGVKTLPTPLWTKERPEPTLEEAATAGLKIQQINSSTKNAIEATKNRQIEGSTGQIEPSTHLSSNNPIESDPWLDEVSPKKPRISDYAGGKIKSFLNQGFGNSSKSKSKKRYSQPDQWRRQPLKIEEMSLTSINKALSDPILRDELTPQLIFNSNYELIKDELGQIIRIDSPPL
ncbi:MAG: hypothetical protein RLZZ574_2261 [Cyanobacteriota bacterium]|jgi:hypothetical protein